MCAINCSGGCPECAPDEHAAGEAIDWLEKNGYTVDTEGFYAIAAAIAKNMKNK